MQNLTELSPHGYLTSEADIAAVVGMLKPISRLGKLTLSGKMPPSGAREMFDATPCLGAVRQLTLRKSGCADFRRTIIPSTNPSTRRVLPTWRKYSSLDLIWTFFKFMCNISARQCPECTHRWVRRGLWLCRRRLSWLVCSRRGCLSIAGRASHRR
jgi:hypothetical protein